MSPPKMAAVLLALLLAGPVVYLRNYLSTRTPSKLVTINKGDKSAENIISAFNDLEMMTQPESPPRKVAVQKIIPPKKEAAPKREQEKVEEPDPPRRKNVCEREGGWKVEFTRHHHTFWRCRYGRHRRHRHD
jgi:hypothetical protein